jgi:hypothetical protein
MATTTNFGWETPDNTDLVKDGAAAMRTLGNSIDTSFVDLKGGTTGQVLAKASNTDLDYSWVAQDDSNAIQNAIVDAKGDLIAATAADTPARLAVGTNGQVLTADSTAATGLAWATPASSGGMTSIASGSLPTGASTITLSSISGSYKNLQLVIRDPYPATATSLALQFNGNTGSVYRYVTTYYGATGPISGVAVDATTLLELSQTSLKNTDNNNLLVVDIYDYANSATNKSGRYANNLVSDSYAQFINNGIFAFNSTTAITSITIRNSNSGVNFSGGTYVLYGVN